MHMPFVHAMQQNNSADVVQRVINFLSDKKGCEGMLDNITKNAKPIEEILKNVPPEDILKYAEDPFRKNEVMISRMMHHINRLATDVTEKQEIGDVCASYEIRISHAISYPEQYDCNAACQQGLTAFKKKYPEFQWKGLYLSGGQW
jgi:hypothetical protein